MKTYFNLTGILLMVSGMLFFSSCDDNDDENEPNSDSPIVGTWDFEAADVSITINDQDIIDYLIEAMEVN